MPFFPLEAIKEEVTPCSSTQRLENNLSVIKNKLLRSGSDTAPASAHCDQRTKLSFDNEGETNSVNNCVKSKVYDDAATVVVNGNAVTNFNYNTSLQTRNNLYNIKSKMLKSRASSGNSDSAATGTARSRTKVNDTHTSNIDSSRDTSADSRDETKVTTKKIYSTESRNIKNTIPPPKPKRKSINSADRLENTVNTNRNLSADIRQRTHTYIVSRNTTPRSMKYNSCVDELKYYNLRNGLNKDPSEENIARKLSSNYEDDLDSGLTTNRTDQTDVNVSLLFEDNKENAHESKKSNDISSDNSTLKENGKKMDNTFDMTNISECNTKDFKYFLMHSDNKTSSASNSVNVSGSDQNSPNIPTDNLRAKIQEKNSTANSTKPKSAQDRTRIPRIMNVEKTVNKNDKSKNVPRNESKYKMEKCINKVNTDLNDLAAVRKKSRTKSEHSSASSSKSKQKRKDSNTNKQALNEDIYTSTRKSTTEFPVKKSKEKSRYSTQNASKSKHDNRPTNSSKMESNDTEDTARSATMNNISRRRRYSIGESFTAKSDKIKSHLESTAGDHEKTRRTTTYINDKHYDNQQTLQKHKTPTILQKNSCSRNDSDCYSKPSDFSPKSDSLKVQCYTNVRGRLVHNFPSTDGTVDCSEASYNNSKVSNRENIPDDIFKQSSQNVYVTQRDVPAVNGHFEKGDYTEAYSDFGDFSLATMRLCGECINYSDLSTQDSFSTNTKDTWTQVHYSDIMKEIKKKKNKEQEEEEIYTSFLKRQAAAGENKKNKRKVRSGNTLRKQRYRRGRELNFNYDKPVQNYLINSSRQHTTTRHPPRDDDVCCGCIKFSYFRRIFNRQ